MSFLSLIKKTARKKSKVKWGKYKETERDRQVKIREREKWKLKNRKGNKKG